MVRKRTVRADGGGFESGWRPAVSGLGGAGVLAGMAVIVLLVVMFGPVGSLSLVAGPFPTVVVGLAVIGVVGGVAGRPRRWWMTWGIGIALVASGVVASAHWWILRSGLVDQHYPPSFLLWVWGALFAVGVASSGWWTGTPLMRVARVITAPIALFASFVLINAHYGYWPTMGALLDRPVTGQVSGQVLGRALTGPDTPLTGAVGQSGPVSSRVLTTVPAGRDAVAMAAVGQFGPVSIPGPPGYRPGPVWVWIPPAFNLVGHADFPVLVMVPGVPGTPKDWEQAGQVVAVANAWARTHGGIAPVMVLTTENNANRDTECVNGTQGNAETYLTRTIPDFITYRLGITRDPARWGFVGFSEGGTCAIGLAAEHPQLYGRFVDIAGDLAPNFGTNTLIDLYANNAVAQLHHEPGWLLSRHHYPHSEGWFAASGEDHNHELIAQQLTRAARAAGMTVFDVSGGPGGHSWTYAGLAFRSIYPALVASMPTPHTPPSELIRTHRGLVVADPKRLPPDHDGTT